MKQKFSGLWLLLAACLFSVAFTGCSSQGDDEDDASFKTREYIVGIGKWSMTQVKGADGTWAYDEKKNFTLEFFGKYNGVSKVKIWENFDGNGEQLHEGTYTVDGNVVNCEVNNQQFMRFDITLQQSNELGGKVTFYQKNLSFEVKMDRTW